jgi:osmotically-inducible protein OsmY
MVVEGIVQIWGFVDSQEQREALRVAAGNVPGVKGVELNVSSTPLYGWE